MPLYEYKCSKCGNRFEKIEHYDAPEIQKCPKCGGKSERQLAPAAIQFKGTGWYVTDYGGKGSSPKSSESSPNDSGSKSTDKSAESKPAESKPAASADKSEKGSGKKKK